MSAHVKDGVLLLQKDMKTGNDNETNDDSFRLKLKNDILTLPCFAPGCVINPCLVFEILRREDFYKSATLTADQIVHSMQELVSDGVLTCNEKRMRYCDTNDEKRSERWQLYSRVFLEDQLSPKAAGSSRAEIFVPVPPCNNTAPQDSPSPRDPISREQRAWLSLFRAWLHDIGTLTNGFLVACVEDAPFLASVPITLPPAPESHTSPGDSLGMASSIVHSLQVGMAMYGTPEGNRYTTTEAREDRRDAATRYFTGAMDDIVVMQDTVNKILGTSSEHYTKLKIEDRL